MAWTNWRTSHGDIDRRTIPAPGTSPGSNDRQFFRKGRRICAVVVYEAVYGPDPYTPEEFARDHGVPLEAVREALDYVANDLSLIE